MYKVRYNQFVSSLVENIPQKYDDKNQQEYYEKGVLIGLLAKLALEDSRNLDTIRKTFGALNKN